MGWETRRGSGRYYVQKQRINGRVTSRYVGRGIVAELAAQLDERDREQREAAQREQTTQRAHLCAPVALLDYHTRAAEMLCVVLPRFGLYQHKRQWRRKGFAMPRLIDPEHQAAFDAAHAIYRTPNPTPAELAEFRRLLSLAPHSVRLFGDMSALVKRQLLSVFDKNETMKVATEERMIEITRALGYPEASELERMLIDEVVLCWLDLYRVELTYAMGLKNGQTLDEMAQWERILGSKQGRYLRAVESLARVRRLLKLPAVQVNIATQGGQQVNIVSG